MTIKEIAELAGVSISTVSKIMNNKDENINPKTRERVLKVVKEYNYTPYAAVKNSSNAKTFLIGVLLQTTKQSNRMLNGILETAQKHGYNIVLLDSNKSTDLELKHITSLCKLNVDGVIWHPINKESLSYERYFRQQNIVVSYINTTLTDSSYHINITKMGEQMTQKLLDFRHTKIACLLKENSTRSKQVFDGFKKCLYKNQINFDRHMELSISDPNFLNKLIAHKITGIVSSHFASSLTLYEYLNKMHYYIPSDFSLVSLKDDVRENLSYPHISSIKIPYQEYGTFICEQLINLCENKEDTKKQLLFTSKSTFDNEYSITAPSSYRAKKIVVVGSINMDITFSVENFPKAGETTRIHNCTTMLGGKGANQAVSVAKLGREVALIGEIGNDSDSNYIFDFLEKENVTTQGIHRDMECQTGKAYIYINNDGESSITILSGANKNLTSNDLKQRQHLFKNAGFCLLSTELALPTILTAAQIAASNGTKNILKPATLKTISDELLSYTHIFVPNESEAATLCPNRKTIEQQADYFLQKGPNAVIITLGHKGCYLRTQKSASYYPASNIVSVDSTGGADAFIAALAAYLIDGYSIETAVKIANYAAGFCVSRQGVVPALVDKNTLETHINKTEFGILRESGGSFVIS